MKLKSYFGRQASLQQRQFLALRDHCLRAIPLHKVAKTYRLSESYLIKAKQYAQRILDDGNDPFFIERKKGPKSCVKADSATDLVVELRKKNLSVVDIKSSLESSGQHLSLDTIHRILVKAGFERLPRRTNGEKRQLRGAEVLPSVRAAKLELVAEEISTGKSGGILAFLPLISELGIMSAISKAGFPETQEISASSYIMSFLALKLMGYHRMSHDDSWSHDRVMGLFAGLSVLPKNASLSSYSYRVSRTNNRIFLKELSRIFCDPNEDTFNLDFKTIPHWGDLSVLEKNYASDRARSVKSVLALIVQATSQPTIAYTNAEIKKAHQHDAVLDFVDFWREGHGVNPKMLVFDSKVTIQQNLCRLNQDGIKFVTLRQRGPAMKKYAASIPKDKWVYTYVEAAKKKTRDIAVYDEMISLPNYEGDLRQLIIVDHSKEPVFMITNELKMTSQELIRKYGRRWLVEQEISEQISFFHLNQLSSSIVVKVDFDLTLTVLAHNLYRKLAMCLPGFEKCTVSTLCRKFIEGRASVNLSDSHISVSLNKRSHLPILFETPSLNQRTELPWMGATIDFKIGTSS